MRTRSSAVLHTSADMALGRALVDPPVATASSRTSGYCIFSHQWLLHLLDTPLPPVASAYSTSKHMSG